MRINTRLLHDNITSTRSRCAAHRTFFSEDTSSRQYHFENIALRRSSRIHPTQQRFPSSTPYNIAIMFHIGPPSSTSGSEPSSRDASPSKGSEWSTTSEPDTKPKTPKQRAKYISSSDDDWSDDSDTPVKPHTSRRKGQFYGSPTNRSRPASDEGSLLASDERSILSIEDLFLFSSSDSGSGSGSEDPDHLHSEHHENDPQRERRRAFQNPEEWEPQHDTRNIDPLKLGEIPVRPLPLVSCSNSILRWFVND